MNDVNISDLALILPELVLIGASLMLILVARRIRNSASVASVTILAALASAAASVWLLSWGRKTGFGGMIIFDRYAHFFIVLIASALSLVVLLSTKRNEAVRMRPAEYHALLLLASTGMMFTVSALDLLTLYLGLELMTLCSYILVGMRVDQPTANEAAIKYFLAGSFASAVLLYGISLCYGVTGGTDFTSIALALSANGSNGNPILMIGIVLLTAGLAFKIAAVPFHAWAPDAYQGGSAPVSAFLAAASKAAGLAALGRVCVSALAFDTRMLFMILASLAGFSIVVGSVVALSQTNTKRLMAYSSISHAGYALLGLIAGTSAGASATMTYAGIYVFMTLGAFGVIIALGERGEHLDGYQGLAAQRPGIAALMLLFLLSLTGIPPTAGFVAKFVVIVSVVRAGYMGLAFIAVVCSVVSAFFYLRIAVLMYMKEPQHPAPMRCPWSVFAALTVAALFTVYGGIFPNSLTHWAVAP